MRTCTVCRNQSPDEARHCVQCGSDLDQVSMTAVALQQLRDNERVSRIRLIVGDDACPSCRRVEAEYSKDKVPDLPTRGCSHSMGCRCFYEPALTEIYP